MFDKGEKFACVNDDFSPTVRQLRAQFPKNNYIDTTPDISLGWGNVTAGARGENPASILVSPQEIQTPCDPYPRKQCYYAAKVETRVEIYR